MKSALRVLLILMLMGASAQAQSVSPCSSIEVSNCGAKVDALWKQLEFLRSSDKPLSSTPNGGGAAPGDLSYIKSDGKLDAAIALRRICALRSVPGATMSEGCLALSAPDIRAGSPSVPAPAAPPQPDPRSSASSVSSLPSAPSSIAPATTPSPIRPAVSGSAKRANPAAIKGTQTTARPTNGPVASAPAAQPSPRPALANPTLSAKQPGSVPQGINQAAKRKQTAPRPAAAAPRDLRPEIPAQ